MVKVLLKPQQDKAYISKIYCYLKVTLENFKFSGSSLALHQCIFACFFYIQNNCKQGYINSFQLLKCL